MALLFLVPFPAASQWQKTYFTGNANINSITGHGTGIIAGSYYSKLSYSVDSANHWTVWGCWQLPRINSVVSFDSVLFACTDYGFYKTTDDGVSWTQLNSGLTTPDVYTLFSHNGKLYAGTKLYGVFTSLDNGVTWSASNNGITNLAINGFMSDGQRIFAGTESGLRKSDDDGLTWSGSSNGLISYRVKAIHNAGMALFCGTDSGVCRSTNQGSTWQPVNNGLANTNIKCITSTSHGIYAGTGGGGVFFSADSGTTWLSVNAGLMDLNIQALFASDSSLYAGTPSGVYATYDGGNNWALKNLGLGAFVMRSFGSIGNRILSSTAGCFITDDHGVNWMPAATDFGGANDIETIGSNLFAANFMGVYTSSDSGITSNLILNTGFESTTIANRNQTILVGGDDYGIYRSVDAGNTWSFIQPGPNQLTHMYGIEFIGSVAVAVNLWTDVLLSTDSGSTWMHILRLDGSFPNLTVHNGGAYISNSDGLYFSSDTGATWILIDSTHYFQDLLITDYRMIGVDWYGVHVSDDGGSTWQTYNDGLDNVQSRGIISDSLYLYVSTDCNAVYRRPKAELGITSTPDDPEANAALPLIFPNPAREQIRISLWGTGLNYPCQMEMYNLQGKKVAETMINDRFEPVDVSRLASGIYILRFGSKDRLRNSKLVIYR